jgi:hypothetical protein
MRPCTTIQKTIDLVTALEFRIQLDLFFYGL